MKNSTDIFRHCRFAGLVCFETSGQRTVRACCMPVLLLCVAMFSASLKAADRLGDFPVPVSANLETIALQVRQNGYLVDIASFESGDSVADTLAFYRDLWGEPNMQDDGSVPLWLSSEVGDRLYISRLHEGLSQVLDLDKTSLGETRGVLSVMTIDAVNTPDQDDYLLGDGELLSLTQTSDKGVGDSTLLMARYARSPESLAERYVEHFASRGWRPGLRQSSASGVLLSFSDGGTRNLSVVITAAPEGGAHAVLSEIER